MSLQRLKYELDFVLVNLAQIGNDANGRVFPIDPSLLADFLLVLNSDISLLTHIISQLETVIVKLDELVEKENDPDITAKLQLWSQGDAKGQGGFTQNLCLAKQALLNTRANVVVCEGKIKNYQASLQPQSTINPPTSTSTPPPTPQFEKLLLPKIHYERFDGNLKKFPYFWSRFKPIHENTSLTNADKLNIMLGLLDGKAKEALNQFAIIDDNYQLAVDLLKKKFGQPSDIIRMLHNEFINLKLDSNAVADAKVCFDKAEAILNQLEANHEELNQSSIQIQWEKKLPAWLYESCLMQLPSTANLKDFRKKAEEILTVKEKVDSRKPKAANITTVNTATGNQANRPQQNAFNKQNSSNNKTFTCTLCEGQHFTAQCTKFTTVKSRIEECRKQNRCLRCLKTNHKVAECKANNECKHCKKITRHHSALCYNKEKSFNTTKTNMTSITDTTTITNESQPTAPVATTNVAATTQNEEVVLPITEIKALNPNNKQIVTMPCLMDCGSQFSYIVESSAKELRLPVLLREQLHIETFNSDQPQLTKTNVYSLMIELEDGRREQLKLRGINLITSKLNMAKLKSCQTKIDLTTVIPKILIGSDYFWQFFNSKLLPSGFYYTKTPLGPIICGKGPTITTTNVTQTFTIHSKFTDAVQNLHQLVEQHWKLESIGIMDDPQKSEKQLVDEFFQKTHRRTPEGQYIVKLPYNSPNPKLKDHKIMCFHRLKSLVKTLKTKNLLKPFFDVLYEHHKLGYIEFITPEMDQNCKLLHYIPYHAVVKDSATTPVRAVFDCSAKLNMNDTSLNDNLFTGSPKMPDLLGMLLRFRCYLIAITADVAKAFMQLLIAEEDRDVLRFLLPIHPEGDITWKNVTEARYTRAIFGAGPSPVLLEQVINDTLQKEASPVSQELSNNIFVDNALQGATTTAAAIAKSEEAQRIFSNIGMNLRNFISNDIEVSQHMNTVIPDQTTFLGIPWKPSEDSIIILFPKTKSVKHESKRTVLAATASVYDPQGLFSPIVLNAKVFIQSLWKQDKTWDAMLTNHDLHWWTTFKNDNEGKEMTINRCIVSPMAVKFEVQIFCDASNKGMAAVAYLRQFLKNGNFQTNILVAKTRVADTIKRLTIPRKELVSATMGASLSEFCANQLPFSTEPATLWTDSTCVLGWLSSDEKHGRFIDNRVHHIKQRVSVIKHVASGDNPADIGSRGCSVDELANNQLWWHGPQWLQLDEQHWPQAAVNPVNIEQKAVFENFNYDGSENTNFTQTNVVKQVDHSSTTCLIDFNKFSNWLKLINTMAAILFFVRHKFKLLETIPQVKTFRDANLITIAESFIILFIQQQNPPTRQVIYNLQLYKDNNGIWLCNHRLPETDSTPKLIYLPYSRATKLLILYIHKRSQHAGPRQTLNELRHKFWLCQGKRIVAKTINNHCWHCRIEKTKPYALPQMPTHPLERTTPSAPFTNVGIDYAGPFQIRTDKDLKKCWLVLFTCMSTRAVHLDITTGLDAKNFLMVFRRFVARRGRPQLIISDNGTNFRAADTLIAPCWFEMNKSSELTDYIATERLKWKFITEKSPWKGGFYERLIGITKTSLAHAIGKRILTADEMLTVVTETEAIVNCRPITPIDAEYKSEEPCQMALRPIDFYLPHGNTNVGIPRFDHDAAEKYLPKETTSDCLKKLMNKTLNVLDRFWAKWNREYLNQLRETSQHFHKQQHITEITPKVGAVVIIEDDNLERGQWKMGIITELNNSEDNFIRTAKVQTANKRILNRPLSHLFPLELQATSIAAKNANDAMAVRKQVDQIDRNTNQAAASDATNANGHTANRYNLRSRTNQVKALFILTLCFFQLCDNSAAECESTANLKLIYAESCTPIGLAIFQSLNDQFCWSKIDCGNNHLPTVSNQLEDDQPICDNPCKCPEWSDDCTFHPATTNELDKSTLLHLIQDETPIDSDTVIHIIELPDGSQHVIRQFNLIRNDAINEIICFGQGTKANGPPSYCDRNPCDVTATKFCLYNHHELVYAAVHNGQIPIRAWKTVERSLPPVLGQPQPQIPVTCNNGQLYINNTDTIRRIQIKSGNSYTVITPTTNQVSIELPHAIITASREFAVQYWNKQESTNVTSVICDAVDYCLIMQPCWLCFDELVHPECRPVKYILLLSNIISYLYIFLHKCCKKRRRRHFSTIRIPYPKRKNSDENVLIRFRRLSTSWQPVPTLTLVFLIFISPISAEGEDLSLTASSQSCTIDAHGFATCKITEVTQFTASTYRSTHLLINFEGRPLGSISIIPEVRLVCQKTRHHFTRLVQMKTSSIKICGGREHCSGITCARADRNTKIPVFGSANDFPGSTFCRETCGGWSCNCLTFGEACLYYRVYATPIDSRPLEVFSCSMWHTQLLLNVTITTQNRPRPIQRLLILQEGHSVEINKIKFAVLDINPESAPPTPREFFISTDQTIAILDEVSMSAMNLVQCPDLETAVQFKNCTLNDNCKCMPADGIASCSCLDNSVLERTITQNALPIQQSTRWLEASDKLQVTSTIPAHPRLQVSIQNFSLYAAINMNACSAQVHELNGCSSCAEGATAGITCKTDFGTAEAHVICPNNVAFPIRCSQEGAFQRLTLFFNEVNVNMDCELRCPSKVSTIRFAATLPPGKFNNPWNKLNTETKPSPSLIGAIIEAVPDVIAASIQFFLTSYVYLLITLGLAIFVALIVLKFVI